MVWLWKPCCPGKLLAPTVEHSLLGVRRECPSCRTRLVLDCEEVDASIVLSWEIEPVTLEGSG